MIFKYKGIDEEGNKVSDKIEALSLSEAKSKLKANKIIYESIKEESVSIFDALSVSMRYKIKPKELSSLSRELSMYIRSGITIVSALKIVQTHYEKNKKMKLFLTTVSTHLDEGKNFYTALESQTVVVLPEFFKHSIKVSESGGILDEVLLELSRFLKEQDKIAKEIKSAFAYPTFMILVSLVMIAFMLAFVVPQITGIFESMNQELPTPTKVVIAMGDFFRDNIKIILASIVVFVIAFMVLMKKSYTFAYGVHKFILKLPLFGEIAQKSELARFAYMASLLTRSGVPFVQTINLSANILNNLVLKELFVNASTKVVEGKLLSNAINSSQTKIDNAFVQSIALGEETSQVQSVLTNISELYFEENREKISLLLTLLEPALMLFVGGSIGFIVAAMLLPIFSMSIS
ncbi:MAG: type II secretion system F family protein [Sulfurimonas sp.]|nr:type II secretion system F family protein [Sulfurimonas sp.]MBU3938323.1 type II secretion system F family protein [bacterium]MBU4025125.1 type II secretion system F family protein [bacterium]MBU4057951.1 type II secretion system F family protein [bacterium]MBU4111654.1 type II secretion system F family protein [bacterium]